MIIAKPAPVNRIITHDLLQAIRLHAAFSKGGQSDTERQQISPDAEDAKKFQLSIP